MPSKKDMELLGFCGYKQKKIISCGVGIETSQVQRITYAAIIISQKEKIIVINLLH